MQPRGGGGGADRGGDAAGTAAAIAPAAGAGLAGPGGPAGGRLPPAAHCQHRPGEEDRPDDQAGGQQQGLQPRRHARGGRRSRSPRQGAVPGARRRRRRWCRPSGRPRRGRCRCRGPRHREYRAGADQVRIRADDVPVGRVQGRPAAAHGEHGRDRGQGVPRHDPVPGRRPPAGQHQDGAGADDIGVGADARPVGRVQGRPAAAHGQAGGNAGQRVAGLHDVPGGGARRRTGRRGDAQRAGEGDLSTTRSAGVCLGRAGRSRHAGRRRHDQQDAPGEHHARGLRPRMHSNYHFPSKGSAPGAAGPDAEGTNQSGRKGLKRAAPPAGRHARSAWRRHDAPAAAAPA